jgi:hypothetical protein
MILYIVDESTFLTSEEAWWPYKKGRFYAIKAPDSGRKDEKLDNIS